MYSRVRFSRWWHGLSGTLGGAALAGVLAGVLAVLLALGAAGVYPPGDGARASAAGAADPARAADHAGPGSLVSGAVTPGPSASAASRPGGSGTGTGRSGTGRSGTGRSGTGRSGTARSGTGRSGTGRSGTGRSGTGRSGTSPRKTSQRGTGRHRASQRGATGQGAGHRAGPARAAAAVPGTSCRSVAHIGDSTSVGLVSPLDLPDPAQRLAAQYRDAGVGHSWIDASGGRSMTEEMPGQVNGYDTARAMVSRGFRGCWVIALGTNDTANVSAGSNVRRMTRIQELMAVAHGAPVMWVNVKTLDPSGPWAEANMQLWNDTLLQACRQYPNLRIFDWAAAAQDGWFISDGIHYTPAGYAARAHLIALALARAFPRSGHAAGCVIP